MKLAVKWAGLCASGTFVLCAIPGFYQQIKPVSPEELLAGVAQGMDVLEVLGVSLGGALLVGLIGYVIGDILSKPQGKPKRLESRASSAPSKVKEPSVTGDETFLDDLDAPAPVAEPYTETSPAEAAPQE